MVPHAQGRPWLLPPVLGFLGIALRDDEVPSGRPRAETVAQRAYPHHTRPSLMMQGRGGDGERSTRGAP